MTDTGTWTPAINVVTVFVNDLPATRRFYEEVFGLPVTFEDDHSAVFTVGSIMVNVLVETQAPELIEPAPVAPHGSGSRIMFTIDVDDVDATCEILRHRGVEILNGPRDRPWGIRTAAFLDPGGHAWEIAH